jgi:glycosyltransferase involved in cell wall biosynthesis
MPNSPTKFIKKLKRAILDLITYLKIIFLPRKSIHVNAESKKILFIGHSYHSITKSTSFLIEYLKLYFEVTEILDDSWNGGSFPDLSFIDESYLGVIFFQNLPDRKVVESIKNDNIIYFPMYDNVHFLPRKWWNNYYNLKIINFSKTLHDKLIEWNFNSIYLQYFPEPKEFNPGNSNEVFFWQRVNTLNIRTLAKLFDQRNVKIHIHKAIDPTYQFCIPTIDEENQFEITYSDWFETKEDLMRVVKQKGIYIAPREFEGIGMSFLEAMAMGKAVIAVDNPTMNEYIVDGQTGYLFKLDDINRIDLSAIHKVQENAYSFIYEGYEKWKKNKSMIIEHILKD